MAAEQIQNRVDYKDYSKVFQRNAFLLVDKMVEMASRTEEDTTELVDEILHSIFFLGKIAHPEFSPRQVFVNDSDMFDDLKETFPEPFNLYSSHLPRRSPFSCVLDMVVHLKGQENVDEIRTKLQELTQELMEDASHKVLYSTTICVSHGNSTDSVRHYGVSMSTKGRPEGQILVAASCLNYWEEDVAYVVMSYYPKSRRTLKNQTFDVNIRLPDCVSCQAFDLLRSGNVKIPCRSCHNMFGLSLGETGPEGWPCGHCAEVESLSKLLREEEDKERVQINGNWTEENRRRVKHAVINHLRRELKKVDFEWDNRFYTAQRAITENDGEEEPLLE